MNKTSLDFSKNVDNLVKNHNKIVDTLKSTQK